MRSMFIIVKSNCMKMRKHRISRLEFSLLTGKLDKFLHCPSNEFQIKPYIPFSIVKREK